MTISKEQIAALISAAQKMRGRAYAPYSHYSVGAALLTSSGQIYCGCNIENAAFAPGLCAERAALAQAVSSGERQLAALAVCGGPEGEAAQRYCYPCGVCRQMLAEFCSGETIVICASDEQHYQLLTFDQLLPYPYPPRRTEEA